MDKGSTATVKIENGHLTSRIKNLKQKDWVKACKKLSLWVPESGGKGSHRTAYIEENCDRTNSNNLVLTIQKKLIPNIQTDKLKQLIAYGKKSRKFTEDDVWAALGIKK